MVSCEGMEDLRQCFEFHGHLCPGLVIGYGAAKHGMALLGLKRSGDEEIVAIVETDSCAVDAIQVMTGCTFGKGNLIHRNHGKMAFTFACRQTGKSVRLYYQPSAAPDMAQVPEANRKLHQVKYLLEQPWEKIYRVQMNPLSRFPRMARIHRSIPCSRCGEMVMETRIQNRGNEPLCIACARTRAGRKPEHKPKT